MIQFKTADGAIWLVDLETLYWAQINKPADEEDSKMIQEGDLTNLNYGRYALAPRTEKTEGAGAGFCTIAVLPLLDGDRVVIGLKANVSIRDFTMPDGGIKEVIYQLIGDEAPEPTSMAGQIEGGVSGNNKQ